MTDRRTKAQKASDEQAINKDNDLLMDSFADCWSLMNGQAFTDMIRMVYEEVEWGGESNLFMRSRSAQNFLIRKALMRISTRK